MTATTRALFFEWAPARHSASYTLRVLSPRGRLLSCLVSRRRAASSCAPLRHTARRSPFASPEWAPGPTTQRAAPHQLRPLRPLRQPGPFASPRVGSCPPLSEPRPLRALSPRACCELRGRLQDLASCSSWRVVSRDETREHTCNRVHQSQNENVFNVLVPAPRPHAWEPLSVLRRRRRQIVAQAGRGRRSVPVGQCLSQQGLCGGGASCGW